MFFFVTDKENQYAIVFVLGNPFQPSLPKLERVARDKLFSLSVTKKKSFITLNPFVYVTKQNLFFVPDEQAQYAIVFVLGNPFQPNLPMLERVARDKHSSLESLSLIKKRVL
jgi:hypothetical protein